MLNVEGVIKFNKLVVVQPEEQCNVKYTFLEVQLQGAMRDGYTKEEECGVMLRRPESQTGRGSAVVVSVECRDAVLGCVERWEVMQTLPRSHCIGTQGVVKVRNSR